VSSQLSQILKYPAEVDPRRWRPQTALVWGNHSWWETG